MDSFMLLLPPRGRASSLPAALARNCKVQGVACMLTQPGARRARVESEAESAYKQRLEQQCYAERLNQQKLYRWGYAERARGLPTKSCDELQDRFGLRYTTFAY